MSHERSRKLVAEAHKSKIKGEVGEDDVDIGDEIPVGTNLRPKIAKDAQIFLTIK
jgi:hypothetical protein